MQLLRARDRAATPWKNGGGITHEVAAFPPGSDFASFLWRVSVAQVTKAGPFSELAQIERLFAVLEGCIRLEFAGRTMDLDAGSDPIGFSGESACLATPLRGPVSDLNLMLRRGKASATMKRVSAPMRSETPTTIVVAPRAQSLCIDGRQIALARFDAVRLDAPCDIGIGDDALVIAIA